MDNLFMTDNNDDVNDKKNLKQPTKTSRKGITIQIYRTFNTEFMLAEKLDALFLQQLIEKPTN